MAARAASPTGIPASGATTADVTPPATADASTIPNQRGLAPADRRGEPSSGPWSPTLVFATAASATAGSATAALATAALATAARLDGGPAGTDTGGVCAERRRRRARRGQATSTRQRA